MNSSHHHDVQRSASADTVSACIMGLVLVALGIMTAYSYMVLVPQCNNFYKSLGVALPGITEWAFSLSIWFGIYGWILILLVGAAACAALVLWRKGYRKTVLITESIGVCGCAFLLAMVAPAMLNPLIGLQRMASGG